MCAFIRFNCGKWTLFTLFSSALYGERFAAVANGDSWKHLVEDGRFWPLFFPLVLGLVFAAPDLIKYWFRKRAINSIAPETTVTANPVASVQPPTDPTEP